MPGVIADTHRPRQAGFSARQIVRKRASAEEGPLCVLVFSG